MPVKVSEIEAVVVAEHHLLAQNLRAILARRLALFNTVELEGRRAGIGRGRARIGRVGHGALARSPREVCLGLWPEMGNCYLKKKSITNYITNYFYTK